MNIPRDTSSAPEIQLVDRIQQQSAEQARTVDGFAQAVRERAKPLLALEHAGGDGAALEAAFPVDLRKLLKELRRRLQLIDEASADLDGVQLRRMPRNQLGENTLSGGRANAALSQGMYAGIRGASDVKQAQHTGAHELAHGRTVKHFTGEFYDEDGQPVDLLIPEEGFAEVAGNERVGDSIDHHREGQPAEVYGEGQEFMVDLIQQAGRERVEDVMTRTGDLTALQPEADFEPNGKASGAPQGTGVPGGAAAPAEG